MSLKTSGLDDFDNFLNDFEAELDEQPVPTDTSVKVPDKTATDTDSVFEMKPTSRPPTGRFLQGGIKLPVSPETSRPTSRRRPLYGQQTTNPVFTFDKDNPNPYDPNAGIEAPTQSGRQSPSLIPVRTPNTDRKFRPAQATTTGDESPILSVRKPFESRIQNSSASARSPSVSRKTNDDYLGLGADYSEPPESNETIGRFEELQARKSSTPISAQPAIGVEPEDDLLAKYRSMNLRADESTTEAFKSNPTPATKKSEDSFSLADVLTGRTSSATTMNAKIEEPKAQSAQLQLQPEQPEVEKEDFASTLLSLPLSKKKSSTVTPKKTATAGRKVSREDIDEEDGASTNRSARLRIPTHILDEEELKGMSTSVKSLYCNQLDLLEASYKDHIVTLTQSHQRKEEILKDEIRALHKDYEERLQRYKSQAQTQDNVNSAGNQEISELIDQVKSLQKQTKWLLEETHSNGTGNGKQIIDNLESTIKSQLSANNQQLSKLLAEQLGTGTKLSERDLEKLNSGAVQRFDEIMAKVITMNSGRNEKLEDLGKSLNSQFHNMVKLQKKYRNEIVRSVLDSMTDSMDSRMAQNEASRHQIKLQLKEFRKDFKRFLAESESKQDKFQKTRTTFESEQSQILRPLQNLETCLRTAAGTRQATAAATMGLLDNSTGNSAELSLQTELELKLLRDERTSFSEAVVQMNVEKRKLTDERICFEQEKYKFEHDKNRLYELESLLNVKSDDLEELKTVNNTQQRRIANSSYVIQQKSDAARNEYQKLSSELSRKLQEFERDSSKQRDVIETIEQKFRNKQQRLNFEKIEVQREKEFLQKLRDQSLCPNCLSHNPIGNVVLEIDDGEVSTKYRSRGDGLELTNTSASASVDQIPNTSASNLVMQLPASTTKFVIDEDILLHREIKYLDDMYHKYFASKK